MADTVELSARARTARRGSLDGRGEARATGVALRVLPPAFRVSLRARADAVAALSDALGFALPVRPKTSAQSGSLAALWLGPDEWLLLDERHDPRERLAGVDVLHSAVDVSHRNVGMEVSGPLASQALSGGCPQNLLPDAFAVNACSRTVLGKAEIVLWRTGEEAFRVECWRSFSPYVFTFLQTALPDAGA